MAKTARLELRVSPEFKARVEAECDRRGMKVATFIERVVEARLAPVRTDEKVLAEEQAFRDIDGSRSTQPVVLPSGKTVRVEPSLESVARREAEKPAALKRGSEVVMRFRCPDARCPRRFGSAQAVCPDHGRKAVET